MLSLLYNPSHLSSSHSSYRLTCLHLSLVETFCLIGHRAIEILVGGFGCCIIVQDFDDSLLLNLNFENNGQDVLFLCVKHDQLTPCRLHHQSLPTKIKSVNTTSTIIRAVPVTLITVSSSTTTENPSDTI